MTSNVAVPVAASHALHSRHAPTSLTYRLNRRKKVAVTLSWSTCVRAETKSLPAAASCAAIANALKNL